MREGASMVEQQVGRHGKGGEGESLTGGRLEEGLRSRGNTSTGTLNFSPAAR